MEQRLLEAFRNQETYQANEAVKKAISETALIGFVGGIAVGKNYLMSLSGLHVTGTETTREYREGDDTSKYRYSSHDDMLDAIEAGELVQYGIATKDGTPTEIYGSRLQDYNLGEANVSDIWADAIHPLYNKGFGSVKAVSVFTPKAQWTSQLSLRLDGMTPEQADARLREARHSIRWSLAQHLGGVANHLVVINGSEPVVDEQLKRITDFAADKHVTPLDDEMIHRTADDMFSVINLMYSRL